MGRIISPKTQAKALAARQRHEQVIALLAQGRSQRAVAREVGLTQPRVCQILRANLRQIQERSLDRVALYRTRQLNEIEAMRAQTLPKAVEPDLAAIDRMLKLQEREARLLGFDRLPKEPASPQPEPPATEWDPGRLSLAELEQLEALWLKAQGQPQDGGPPRSPGSDGQRS
jgi:predicted XRE-type DNA-binding protein